MELETHGALEKVILPYESRVNTEKGINEMASFIKF